MGHPTPNKLLDFFDNWEGSQLVPAEPAAYLMQTVLKSGGIRETLMSSSFTF